mgnify:CR=1 FL=1
MTAVYKRELRSYFTSMVGYVFIAILIFFVGIYFMAYNLFGGYPSFGYVLLSCTIIFMVAVPILTMRSMAEDRRGKTDQLLLTSPVSLTGIVLGKYLAMVTVLLVPILLICFCPLIIAMNGSATLTADYAAILAFFCMGCVYIAVGMFVSALTESQIIAAVGTFGLLLVLYLWDGLLVTLQITVLAVLLGFVIGFLVAMVLFSGVRRRVEEAVTPKCFEGLPITLVAAAVTSLSFMGFGGIVESIFGA